jgi:hypothetical protein
MSHCSTKERATRCLVPCALREVIAGAAPWELLLELNLPAGTPFEAIESFLIDSGGRQQDSRLLDRLVAVACPGRNFHPLSQATPAFPQGIAGTIDLRSLPLHTYTRNCLEKGGLFSPGALERVTLRELLAIPRFGVKSLVDLLTAVEAANRASEGKAVTLRLGSGVGDVKVASLLPRLTHEAELLGREPWAPEVGLFDARLGRTLLVDEEPPKGVRQALRTGRVDLEQPLCPGPLCFDLDARLLPLDENAVDLLVATGLTTLRAMACLSTNELLFALCEMESGSRAQLFGLLDACRFLTPQATGAKRVPTLAEFCRAVVNRTSDTWFSARLANRIARTRALGGHYSSLSLEEELLSLADVVALPRSAFARAYLGWDGQGRRTAQQIGQARRVCAATVRSITDQFCRRWAAVSVWAPTVRRALAYCPEICPVPAEGVARLLHERGFAGAPFHPHGLLTAGKLLGIAHTFSLQPCAGIDWLVRGDRTTVVGSSVLALHAFVRGRGVCSIADVRAASGATVLGTMSEDALREWVIEPLGVHWLDSDRTWFRYPSGRGLLESNLWKILAVAPEIRAGELEAGLKRHRRPISVPSGPILLALCRDFGLQVKGDLIRTPKPVRREKVLKAIELTVFEVLQTEGPLLPGTELEKRCFERGANRNTYLHCITYSPIVARYGAAVYGLRGARVFPGEVEAVRARAVRGRRGKGITSCGRRRTGVPWITYKIRQGMVNCGTVPIPAGVRHAVGEGRWPLLTVDGTQVGELACRRAFAWGWLRYFRQSGAAAGDIMVLEIDRDTGMATIAFGGQELWNQSDCPMSRLTAKLDAPLQTV